MPYLPRCEGLLGDVPPHPGGRRRPGALRGGGACPWAVEGMECGAGGPPRTGTAMSYGEISLGLHGAGLSRAELARHQAQRVPSVHRRSGTTTSPSPMQCFVSPAPLEFGSTTAPRNPLLISTSALLHHHTHASFYQYCRLLGVPLRQVFPSPHDNDRISQKPRFVPPSPPHFHLPTTEHRPPRAPAPHHHYLP